MSIDRGYSQDPGKRHVYTCPFCKQEQFVVFRVLCQWRCYGCGAQGTIERYQGEGLFLEPAHLPLDNYPEPLTG